MTVLDAHPFTTRFTTLRLKHLLAEREERLGPNDAELLGLSRSQGVVPRASMGDSVAIAESKEKYKRVSRGELVMNKMQAWSGAFALSAYDGVVSPDYTVLRFAAMPCEKRFVEYVARSPLFAAECARVARGMGTAFLRVNTSDLLALRIPYPPLRAQTSIADYLDRETERIDALIKAKRRLAALLDERFRTLLTELIFAGCVDRFVPIRRICTCLAGYTFPSALFVHDEADAVRLLRGVNVTPSGVRWDETVYFPRSHINAALGAYSLSPGDLVIGMDRPVIRSGMRVAEVKPEDTPALLVQRVARIRANSRSTNAFLRYALMSPAFQDHFLPITTGVSVPHISEDQILAFRVPSLTPQEQAKVVHALEAAEATKDRLQVMLQNQLVLLDEHRQALITAAVAGQIDLAEAA